MHLPPLSWSRGLTSLSPGVVPCRGLRPDERRETHGRLCAFIDRWGVTAHEAGWDTLRLFGVGPETGALRGDYRGVLIPCTRDVLGIDEGWIQTRSGGVGRLEPVKMPGMVPLWEFKRRLAARPSGRSS